MSKRHKYISIAKLVPNVITIFSLCCGLLAVHHSLMMHWERACLFIVIAAILDTMDGRFARMLNAMSDFGANLDSLCDFVNYAVFPSLIMYNWSLWNHGHHGWYAVMASAVCGAVRLARFNTEDKLTTHPVKKRFFRGIPSPAAGILILLPLIVHNGFREYLNFSIQYPPFYLYEVYISIVAISMVGTFPTPSLKYIKIPRHSMPLTLVLIAFILLSFFVFRWQAVVFYCVIYCGFIPLSLLKYNKMMKALNNTTQKGVDK